MAISINSCIPACCFGDKVVPMGLLPMQSCKLCPIVLHLKQVAAFTSLKFSMYMPDESSDRTELPLWKLPYSVVALSVSDVTSVELWLKSAKELSSDKVSSLITTVLSSSLATNPGMSA